MAYSDLKTIQDPKTGDPIKAAWGRQIRTNQEDHEGRIATNEALSFNLIDPRFGAIGNGDINDTAAILAAFDAAEAAPGVNRVTSPPGLTFLCDPVVLPTALVLELNDSTLKASSAGDIITVTGDGVTIRKTGFDSNSLAARAITATDVNDLTVDVKVAGFSDRAVDLHNVKGGDIACVSDNSRVAVRAYGACEDVDIHDITATLPGLYGAELRADAIAGSRGCKLRRITVKDFPTTPDTSRQGVVVYGEYGTHDGDVNASPYHHDVTVEDCDVIGPGLNWDLTAAETGTGDHYSVQRTIGLQMRGNKSSGGGENAYSVTRYVYGGVVEGNTGRDMFGHNVQIGVFEYPTEDVATIGNVAKNVNLSLGGLEFAAYFFQYAIRPVVVGNVADAPGYYGYSFTGVADATYVGNYSNGELTAKELIQGNNTWNIRDQFGVRSSPGYTEIGDGPYALSGELRFPNLGAVKGRNADNTADLNLVRADGLNRAQLGDVDVPGRFPGDAEIDGALRHSGDGAGVFGAFTVQLAANPDTAGATVGELETEINELKSALRAFGIIAT